MEDIQSDEQKIERIKSIIEKEINKELISKQNEVLDISEKIKVVLRNIELLKYVVAVSYFDQNSLLTSKKNQDEDNEDEKPQNQIHPCIKKLLPFRSNYNKVMGDILGNHSYETRNNKRGISNETAPIEIKKEVNGETAQKKCDGHNKKIPQYIPPLPNTEKTIGTGNLARGNVSKDMYRIAIGNVSKWIPPDTREDNSTHKWMVYIRNKDESKDVTKLLKKVRYFLHESYKPHDIIDVTEPFQLTRRGWGEFPIRVQLHFVNPLNKPVDIIHNLKLDMTCSGIQTLGAETVVEVCLYQSTFPLSEKEYKKSVSNSKCGLPKEEIFNEKQDIFDGSLLTSINGFRGNARDIREEITSDLIVKQEPDEAFGNESFLNPKLEKMESAIRNSRKFLLDRRKAIKIIEIEHNYLGTDDFRTDKTLNEFTNSPLTAEPAKNQKNEKNLWRNGTIFDTISFGQAINKKNQQRLSRIGLNSGKSEEEMFRQLKLVVGKLEAESQSKYCTKAVRHMYLVNVLQRAHATKLDTVEPLLKWFVQRWPIITKLAMDPTYKTVHPYSCPSEEEFFKYNLGKQRSSEWFRAKAIQKVLKSLKPVIPIKEEIWSTKQILLWSRFHGYFPCVPQLNSKSESAEANDGKIRKLKLNESSSDSEDGSESSGKTLKIDANKYLNGLIVSEKKKNFKKSRRKDFEESRFADYREFNTCTESNDGQRFGANEFRILQPVSECDIEIVEVDGQNVRESPVKRNKSQISMTTIPSDQSLLSKFICETTRQIGVKITDEEILPEVKCDSVIRVISQSVHCFLEDLLRRSLARAWMRNGDRCPESVKLNDILATLIEHPRFDIFTNRGLGQTAPGKSDA